MARHPSPTRLRESTEAWLDAVVSRVVEHTFATVVEIARAEARRRLAVETSAKPARAHGGTARSGRPSRQRSTFDTDSRSLDEEVVGEGVFIQDPTALLGDAPSSIVAPSPPVPELDAVAQVSTAARVAEEERLPTLRNGEAVTRSARGTLVVRRRPAAGGE